MQSNEPWLVYSELNFPEHVTHSNSISSNNTRTFGIINLGNSTHLNTIQSNHKDTHLLRAHNNSIRSNSHHSTAEVYSQK